MGKLYDSLKNYANDNVYPYHMPGHKRISCGYGDEDVLNEIFKIDITEISGFDNLNAPSGIIKESEDFAAKLYGSEHTHFLVNGSTVGILSAISALAHRGDKLIVARNCHKSVYHAAYLNKLRLEYVYPSFDHEYGINGVVEPSDIEAILRNSSNVAGIVITSPTYDGVVSDVSAICKLAHGYDIPVIIDEAHGAHFGFEKHFPESSVKYADIVIHSVHKTLPAPTQTALIHINSRLVTDDEVTRYIHIYQSSSPSYILMAGIDRALDILNSEGEKRFQGLFDLRSHLTSNIKDLKHIIVCPYTEPGKLVIALKETDKTGLWLSDELRDKYKLEMEMASSSYVLGILTMMDTKEGVERLIEALKEIDNILCSESCGTNLSLNNYPHPAKELEMFEAWDNEYTLSPINESVGKVAADFINLYPPGYPIIVPGEVISEEIVTLINDYIKRDYAVQGIIEGCVRVREWED